MGFTSNIYFKLQKTPDTDNISEKAPNLNNFREIPIRISVKERDQREESSSEDQGRRRTTFASEEVRKFESLANSWWDPNGECKPLHSLNKLRKGLHESKACDPNFLHGPQPLKGLKILDVGCGGGILCEVTYVTFLCTLWFKIIY
ncbi:Ubiquinone biosynthesis O-methyltransferase [Armadillidium vulgare]|nr:Ubiquinone biosynthesis O-methyltransferase [Armadillidium vulgare]